MSVTPKLYTPHHTYIGWSKMAQFLPVYNFRTPKTSFMKLLTVSFQKCSQPVCEFSETVDYN